MRYTPNGSAVTNFSVATNRRYTTADGEQREETEWFRVAAWNRLAETCNQYVTKGMKVYVEGRLNSRPYITQDGQAPRRKRDKRLRGQVPRQAGSRRPRGRAGRAPPGTRGRGPTPWTTSPGSAEIVTGR